MICNGKYLYKINLVTGSDVAEFVKIASHIDGKVWLVCGDKRLSAKSILGVHLARMAWNEIYVESENDCFFELRKFIED
ncbi:MAG: HPr family phosphocarrier protein [Eubacteriales bacterium]